jgi:hypothetical protein
LERSLNHGPAGDTHRMAPKRFQVALSVEIKGDSWRLASRVLAGEDRRLNRILMMDERFHIIGARFFKSCREWTRVCESGSRFGLSMGRITPVLPKASLSVCRGVIA